MPRPRSTSSGPAREPDQRRPRLSPLGDAGAFGAAFSNLVSLGTRSVLFAASSLASAALSGSNRGACGNLSSLMSRRSAFLSGELVVRQVNRRP